MRSRQVWILVALLCVAVAGVGAEETRTVAAGPQYKAGGFQRMPPQWYAINGKETLAALQKRRAGLVD